MGSAVSPIELRCCTAACKRHVDEPCGPSEVPGVAVDFSDTRQSQQSVAPGRSALDALDARQDLCSVIKLGDATRVRELLRSRASVDASNGKGSTPLHVAVSLGHLDIVEALLLAGARKLLKSKDQTGKTPFALAIGKHRLGIARLLQTGSSGDKEALKTGLFKAAFDGVASRARELLECRAAVEGANSKGNLPLHVAARQGHAELCELLVRARAGCEAKAKGSSTDRRPITDAAKHGHMAVVKCLVNIGARVRKVDREHLSDHLLLATETEDVKRAQDLLTYGANRSVKDKKGQTPLLIAAEKENEALCRLLSKGTLPGTVAVTSEESSQLGAMLLQASIDGHLPRATNMLAFGARIDAADCFSETPLWKAACKGHVDIARLLLMRRAPMEQRSKNCNRTPIAIAIDRGHLEIADLLLKEGGLLPEPRTLTRSLYTAARLGEATRVRTLLYARADVHAVDAQASKGFHNTAGLNWQGQEKVGSQSMAETEPWNRITPLQCAAAAGHAEVVKLLTEAGAKVPARDKEGFQLVQGLLKSLA